MRNIPLATPPWQLEGSGYILLYNFSKKEINSSFFLSEKFIKIKKGGLGAMMIVDYKKSAVGPYQEILIIPGKFFYNKKKRNTISKIFVSTQESVINGIKNWAIPKEEAHFSFEEKEKIVIKKGEKVFFEASFKSYGPRFPVNTLFLPFPLVQEKEGLSYYTTFKGKGLGQLSRVKEMKIDKNEFPNISNKKPLLVVKINPFKITFPVPRIEKAT